MWLTLGVVIVAIQAALVREGEPVLNAVTTGGLTAGLKVFGRLMAVVLLSALFVATTEPYALACGLMRVGLPYRWGFAFVASLRLAPVFRVEAHQVYRAQLVRGVAYDAGGPRRWWLLLRHLCLPLLVSALRTAQWLALSMEGRGFGLHPQRTYMHEPRAAARDFVTVGLLLASIVVAVLVLAR